MIDVHSHFFNLKYLPVAGIIRRYSNNRISHTIATGIERLLLRNTASDFAESSDSVHIEKQNEVPVLVKANKELPEGSEKSIMDLTEEESINRILNRITDSDLDNELVHNALDVYQTIELEQEKLILFDINKLNAMHSTEFEKVTSIGLVGRLLKWISDKMEQGKNYIRWFSFMMRSEREMVAYIRANDEPLIKLFIHQMMDVDYFFRDEKYPDRYKSYYSYDKQIENMHQLNNEYPGVLMGMVAFDPSKPECMDIIHDAISNKGFIGVKFYPPMGYKAWADPNFSVNITALLDYCVTYDIPLFTHCNNQGFEAFPKKHSGYNSHPANWENALKQPKYHNLRLCLGHAGGANGWFTPLLADEQIAPAGITDLSIDSDAKQDNWNASYAKIVYKLCMNYPNVYCDAAYLDEITEKKERDNFMMRLQRIFNAQPAFSKKIIYGSDWHMLFQEGKNGRYMQDYIDLFNDTGFSATNRQDFFEQNALRYLKM